MKSKIIILSVVISLLAVGEEKKESKTKKAVSSTVSGIISGGKNVLKGIKEGIDTGRKDGESLDGAILISDKESLEKNITFDIISVEKNGQYWTVNLIIKNDQDKFVRLTNLYEQKNLQLLNEEGLAVFSTGANTDITIPSKASGKASFNFILEGTPKKVRIYEAEFELSQAIVNENKETETK